MFTLDSWLRRRASRRRGPREVMAAPLCVSPSPLVDDAPQIAQVHGEEAPRDREHEMREECTRGEALMYHCVMASACEKDGQEADRPTIISHSATDGADVKGRVQGRCPRL